MLSKNVLWSALFLVLISFTNGVAQELNNDSLKNYTDERQRKDWYIYDDHQKLQIVVHIWGEVNRPGQYIVPDGTNVLELISLAGGPTEFSNLSNIKLTREYTTSLSQVSSTSAEDDLYVKKEIVNINLKDYLGKKESAPIPILKPGNVVKISKNLWSRWQTFIRVISQVAIVIQALYFYSQIDNN